MDIIQTLAQQLNLTAEQVGKTVQLIDEGNTIPFIARYRKELHGAMDDTSLRTLEERLSYLRGLQERREAFLLLAAEAQILLDEDRTEDLAALAADWKKQETAVPPGPGLFPHALRVLSKLEALDGDWRELLRRAEEAPPAAVPETLLERLGTYFAFRYLLKAVNDGDLLGQAQFCVLMVLTAQRLTAVCGFWEAVRRLCCEVEHSEETLEALRLAFLRDAALSPGAFLCQLRS